MKCLMPCKDSILIGFLFLLVFFFFFVRGESDSDSDIWALSELKRGVSDPAGVLSTWGAPDLGRGRHCSWLGVSCGSDSRVVGVRLAGAERGNLPGSLSCSASGRFRRGGSGSLGGQISPLVGRLRELRVLSLPYNDLVGEVPVEIWGLENLRVLDLEGNSLTGKLPFSFGGLRNLRVLNLGFNRFSGEIPVGLSQCRDLKVLNLAGNEVTGNIPASLGRLSNLRGLCLSRNRLAGEIPGSLGECRQLRRLLLFSNRLNGVVPREFGHLRKLEILDVSGNGLSGPIPAELGRCMRMMVLGLSNGDSSARSVSDGENRFEGSIPVEIVVPPSLKIVWAPRGDATMNYRRDRVLTSVETQSDNQHDLSMISQNETVDQSGNGGLNSIEVASVASASAIVVVLFALIILFFYTRKWMPDSRVQGLEPREITFFSNVGAPMSYEGIVRATGNFNASNCIGNGGFGSTFRSEIQPGVIVAVKRLSLGRFQQGIQQFHAEVKTLGRVRHPNLVTLLGYHASETEMFLIYNYLPGGNLEKFIKERSERATDWKVLHKIALDIAHALAYLHDYCVPRVLHRDVKPSNILLDNDLNAYLSDFGLSRLLGTSETHATTGVAGTFGYLAPEYAMTCRVSDKSDVYSYGVVLLELISDKRPLDPSFSSHGDGFNIVTWACLLLKQGRAKEVFTAGLWDNGPHDDLVEMLHLAVTCTNETLSIRPTMKHVVQRLKRIKPVSLSSP